MTTRSAGWIDRVVADMVARLEAEATPERAEKERAYLRSDLEFLGATVPATRRAVVAVRRASPDLSHAEVVRLVDALWGRGIHELRMAAVEVLDQYADRLTPGDVALIERLLRESRTWVLVDGLAACVTGLLRERFPDSLDHELARWARDDDFWLRRASLLAYLPGLRRGADAFHRFAALADPMLQDREFFIRKAIGWVLRETAKKRPAVLVNWLEPRLDRAAGLTVREALKYVPETDRRRLLEAHRAGYSSERHDIPVAHLPEEQDARQGDDEVDQPLGGRSFARPPTPDRGKAEP
jgi:3-methyladenine DNA glycosylase AlkD